MWLDAQHVASSAAPPMSVRHVRRLLRAAANDDKRLGERVIVRESRTRGGRSGIRMEVWAGSLDPSRWPGFAEIPPGPPAVQPDLPAPLLAGGQLVKIRKHRSDRGKSRVLISRLWDGTMLEAGIPPETMRSTADWLDGYVHGAWADRHSCGARQLRRVASEKLVEETLKAGFKGDKRLLRKACKIPINYIRDRRAEGRWLHDYDHDRKRWDDLHKPRIGRGRGKDTVGAINIDATHRDEYMRRADGSLFTPKMIAIEQLWTGRLFTYVFFIPKGQMLRTEHVIEAICAYVADPHGGVPTRILMDNGSEMKCLEELGDLVRLAAEVSGLDMSAYKRPIVKTRKYQGSGKPVERAIGIFSRMCSVLEGSTHGNRILKKVARLGQAPDAYSGGTDEYLKDIAELTALYNATPRDGWMRGASADELTERSIAAGYKPVRVDPAQFRLAFVRERRATVKQGRIIIDKNPYTAPELQRLPAGARVAVLVPIVWDGQDLPVMNRDGSLLCVARYDAPRPFFDPDGPQEAARRVAEQRNAIKSMRRKVIPVNMNVERRILIEPGRHLPVPEDGPVIEVSPALKEIARQISAPAADRAARERLERDREMEWRTAATEAAVARMRAAGGNRRPS